MNPIPEGEEKAQEPPEKRPPKPTVKTYVRYILVAVFIGLMLYSLITGHLHPADEEQKKRNEKVADVLQKLYKLIQMTQNLPNIGFANVNAADPLDDLNANILRILDLGGNFTEKALEHLQ